MASVSDDAIHEVRRGWRPAQQPGPDGLTQALNRDIRSDIDHDHSSAQSEIMLLVAIIAALMIKS